MFLRRLSFLHERIPSHKTYPFNIAAFKRFETIEFNKNVTFFVGENGSGKSTLLEAIAYKCDFNTYEPYGGESLHKQSHGESFLSLFANRFGKQGIYLLDEPEAALSPARQLTLLRIIRDIEQESQSQFIIATHSPIILAYPDAQILDFDTSPVSQTTYEDTSHYQITKGFLENRGRYFRKLFED